MTVYRTPAAGETFHLDLGMMLREWNLLPPTLRAPMACRPPGMGGPAPEAFCDPEKAAGIAQFLLKRLASEQADSAERETLARRIVASDTRSDSGDRARKSIAMLAKRLAELGWLAPFHGLAHWKVLSNPRHHARSHTALDNEWPWLPAGEENRLLRHAWCVCAVSYMSPPSILWTQAPSLTWWRGDNVIELRWLGGGR